MLPHRKEQPRFWNACKNTWNQVTAEPVLTLEWGPHIVLRENAQQAVHPRLDHNALVRSDREHIPGTSHPGQLIFI